VIYKLSFVMDIMDIMQILIFLQGLPSDTIPIDGAVPGALAAIAAILVGFIILFFVFVIFAYIYGSIAFMSISKRTGIGPAGIAWIPLIGKPLLASRIARMHWWPILLLLVFFLAPFSTPIDFMTIIVWVGSIVFGIYYVIWHWKMFEAVGRPGWWILLTLIPLLGILLWIIFLGIAAWGKGGKNPQIQQEPGKFQVEKIA